MNRNEASAPKGARFEVDVAARLKACPDTNRVFAERGRERDRTDGS